MPNDKNIIQEPKKETPQSAKELFQDFLFPCHGNKTPDIQKGQSWLFNPKKAPPIRSIDKPLCGLDCGEAGLVVVDIDAYKEDFKNSKEAQDFLKECLKQSKFRYKTPRGGWHCFFKGHSKSFAPFPGVEIKASGGYVVLYDHPAKLTNYENWQDFYKDLPEFNFKEWGIKRKEHREFGPGKNNLAIPQRAWKAGAKASITKATKDIIEMFSKNQGREWDKQKHVADYLDNLQKSWTPIPSQPFISPFLNDEEYSKTFQNQDQDQPISIVTSKPDTKEVKWLVPGLIPFSFYSVWAGPTGKGRTTTLLNLLTLNAIGAKIPGTDNKKGDKRPFLYHGPENSLNIIQKRVIDAGGSLKDIHFFKQPDLPPMFISHKNLLKEFIKAIESKKFSAVVADTLYLLFKDQNKNAGDVLMPIIKALKTTETAFIGVCHLKKNIQDQEIIHHIRGDSDIVTYARSVVYLREGKEKTQRVIVPLKNSLSGDLDCGFVTTMANNDSPISFEHHEDDNFKILKEYGKPFSSFTEPAKNSKEDNLISDVLAVFKTTGQWKTKDFYNWLHKKNGNKKTTDDAKRKAGQRIMKKAGLKSEQNSSGEWFLTE